MELIIRIGPSPVWLAFRHEPGFKNDLPREAHSMFPEVVRKVPKALARGAVPFEERIRPLPLDPFDPIPLCL